MNRERFIATLHVSAPVGAVTHGSNLLNSLDIRALVKSSGKSTQAPYRASPIHSVRNFGYQTDELVRLAVLSMSIDPVDRGQAGTQAHINR